MIFKKTFAALLLTTSVLTSAAFADDKDYILQFGYGALGCTKICNAPHVVKAREATDAFHNFEEKLKKEKQSIYSLSRYPNRTEENQGHSLLQSAVKSWETAADAEETLYTKGLLLREASNLISSFIGRNSLFAHSSFEKGLKAQKQTLSQCVSELYEKQAHQESEPAAKAAWLVTSAKQLELPQINDSLLAERSPLSFYERGTRLYQEAGRLYEKAAIDGSIEVTSTYPLKSLAYFNLEVKEKDLPSVPKLLASLCHQHAADYTHAKWYYATYPNDDEKNNLPADSLNYKDVFEALEKNLLDSASLLENVAQSSEKLLNTRTKAHLMREASKRINHITSLASIKEIYKTCNMKLLEKKYERDLEDAYSLYELALKELEKEAGSQEFKPHLLVRLADIRYEQARTKTASLTEQKKLLEEAQTQLEIAKGLYPNIIFNDYVWHGGSFDPSTSHNRLDKKIESFLERVKVNQSQPEKQ